MSTACTALNTFGILQRFQERIDDRWMELRATAPSDLLAHVHEHDDEDEEDDHAADVDEDLRARHPHGVPEEEAFVQHLAGSKSA